MFAQTAGNNVIFVNFFWGNEMNSKYKSARSDLFCEWNSLGIQILFVYMKTFK